MTPMQQQYNSIKSQHPHDVVLFRLGDFYEAFNTDAETLSKVLGITLTGRGKDANRVPMAGIPHHALDNYLPKLVKAGIKVVMVDQLTEPKPGELVERGITKIHTAGTVTDRGLLDDSTNNYIASLYTIPAKQPEYALVFADISTGQMYYTQTQNISQLKTELSRIQPAEIILSENDQLIQLAVSMPEVTVTKRPVNEFELTNAEVTAKEQFKVQNLKGFGIVDMPGVVSALGGLIAYLRECQKSALEHLKQIRLYPNQHYMQLDAATIRNLELIYPASGQDYSATVYYLLNQCETNMGKRKLRDWLLRPLLNQEWLQARWDAVESFTNTQLLTSKLKESLSMINDIERIVGRIGVGNANARDLLALKTSLTEALNIASLLADVQLSERISHLLGQISGSTAAVEVIKLIEEAIHPEPPVTLAEGQLIRTGYNSQIDELRDLTTGGKTILAQIQAREIERTGITSLKVGFNSVFGYYIEVTNSHREKVPTEYIRKQTLTNAERYITQELKEWEDKILSAEGQLIKLEQEIFQQVRQQIAEHSVDLLQIADAIAELDVLTNFAYLANNYRYVKPEVVSGARLAITEGRHPVIERLQSEFTPNSVDFDADSRIVILTGPNMSGKSTYIRQVALLTLLAQIGCFVPAKAMKFSLVDRIFTRVGASDNLSRGESTFMVEMSETANILNNATENSLIILDEVGRGTSTYDGVAIAWAIVEYIQSAVKSHTLFATHYHELIELAEKFRQIKNYHVQVSEKDGEIKFQHKIAPGSTSRSYGVHVAEMAGVPEPIVKRANEILESFESKQGKSNQASTSSKSRTPVKPKRISPLQLGLLDNKITE